MLADLDASKSIEPLIKVSVDWSIASKTGSARITLRQAGSKDACYKNPLTNPSMKQRLILVSIDSIK